MSAETTTTTHSRDEAEIRSMIAGWARAFEAKDVGAMMANYAPDAVLFDLKPPFRIQGAAGYRRMWEKCLPHFPKAFKADHRDLHLTVGEDVAFCHALHHVEAVGEAPAQAGDTWIRVTVCYQKINGRWRVVHEHVSVPFDPMTGRVAYITNPAGG